MNSAPLGQRLSRRLELFARSRVLSRSCEAPGSQSETSTHRRLQAPLYWFRAPRTKPRILKHSFSTGLGTSMAICCTCLKWCGLRTATQKICCAKITAEAHWPRDLGLVRDTGYLSSPVSCCAPILFLLTPDQPNAELTSLGFYHGEGKCAQASD